MADRVIQRNDTAARWQSINPILATGEIGIEIDGAKGYKIGDGKTRWNDLPYPGNPASIVQDLGNNENSVPSQKLVTEKLSELGSKVGSKTKREMQLTVSDSKQSIQIEIPTTKKVSVVVEFDGGVKDNKNNIKVALYKDIINQSGFVWESGYFGFNEQISYSGEEFNVIAVDIYPNMVAVEGESTIIIESGLSSEIKSVEYIQAKTIEAVLKQMYVDKSFSLYGNATVDDNGIVVKSSILWSDNVVGTITLSEWNDNACEYEKETATHGDNTIVYSMQYNNEGALIKETININ